MRGEELIKITILVAAMVVAVTAVDPPVQEKIEKIAEDDTESLEPDRKATGEQEKRDKFLFGSFSTTVYTNYLLSTSTVFFTCLAGTNSESVCQGRGRRPRRSSGSRIHMDTDDNMPSIPEVNSSVDEDYDTLDTSLPKAVDDSRQKFAFTIWTTSRVTSSLIVFFTNSSTTVRISYFCSAGLIRYPIFRC